MGKQIPQLLVKMIPLENFSINLLNITDCIRTNVCVIIHFEVNLMEKELLIKLIQETDDERILKYLYAFTKDFIERHSVKQIIEQCEAKNQPVHH